MPTSNPFADTTDELLVPLERSFADGLCGDDRFQTFAGRCERAADMFKQIGEDDAAALTQMLGMLGRVLDGLSSDDDTVAARSDSARREVQEFIESALMSLRSGLAGELDDAEITLIELVESAQLQWCDHLHLFADAGAQELEGMDDQATWETDVENVDAGSQVDMILSALHEAPETVAELGSAGEPDADVCKTSRTGILARPSVAPNGQECPSYGDSGQDVDAPPLDPELVDAYLEDAGQCLASMERAILDYENDPNSPDPIQQLCRDLHTLKGASASVGFDQLASQLHGVEEQLEQQRADNGQVPVELVMNCVDAVRAQIASLQPRQSRPIETTGTTPTVPAAMPAPALTDDGPDTGDSLRVRTVQLDRLMDLLADVVMWRSRREKRITELDTAGDELSRSLFRLQAIEDQFRNHDRRPRTQDTSERSGVSSVTELLSDVREITQQLQQTRQGVADENRAVSQFIQQFRHELVQIKRMPLAGLFQRLHRSVRDAARVEGKEVRLEILGEQTGLDRSIQEKLYEPLLHLVRNAVSHGIESKEKRIAAGKPPVGTVTLEAFGSPHVLILEVRDDGGGLDYDAIRRRGVERGLIFADRPVSNAELARLIFRPGFSTREETNEVAGRGVGMNVVEAALDRLQCHIETESEPGCGTRFRLTIPLRSVIQHTLLFRCCGQSFALPMEYVKSASIGREQVQPVAGDVACRLADLLKLPAGEACPEQHWIEIAHRDSSGQSKRESRLCWGVDEILGPEEVVVRPLPPLLRRHPHLCGMTLSGSGEIVLLLDGRRLVMDAATDRSATTASGIGLQPVTGGRNAAVTQVLVVDDSLSARRRLVQRLRIYGFEITEAGDGVEAIDLLRAGDYDAVFSDLEMPQLGGFDLLNEMMLLGKPAPPCVIVTTRNEPETMQRAETLGAVGFLSKPVDAVSVNEIVSRLGLTELISKTGDE